MKKKFPKGYKYDKEMGKGEIKKVDFWEEYNKAKKEKEIFLDKYKFSCTYPDCEGVCDIKNKTKGFVKCSSKEHHQICVICKMVEKDIKNPVIDHEKCKEEAVETMIEYNERVVEEIAEGKAIYIPVDVSERGLYTLLWARRDEEKEEYEDGDYFEVKKERFDEYKKGKLFSKKNFSAGCYNNKGMKPCPHCGGMIEKEDGCNQMTCDMCNYQWCWMCGAECKSKSEDNVSHFKNNKNCVHAFDENLKSEEDGTYCSIMKGDFRKFRTVAEIMATAADYKDDNCCETCCKGCLDNCKNFISDF